MANPEGSKEQASAIGFGMSMGIFIASFVAFLIWWGSDNGNYEIQDDNSGYATLHLDQRYDRELTETLCQWFIDSQDDHKYVTEIYVTDDDVTFSYMDEPPARIHLFSTKRGPMMPHRIPEMNK